MPEGPRRVAFRVDSGLRIGSGHLARCLTLANELRLRGAEVRFVCRELEGHSMAVLERDGHVVVRLDAPETSQAERDGGGSDWLQVAGGRDAEETRSALGAFRPDTLVVDHYGIDADWERALRSVTESIVVIDDLANRPHDCDLLLDQNLAGPGANERYERLVPEGCRVLLGPRYALLRPEYATVRRSLVARGHAPRRVLVFFGATDPTDETSKTLEALSREEFRPLAVDVVLGANHPAPTAVERRVGSREGTMLYEGLRSLAGLMARADLGIGAGGTTTWERLCLKLPSVVVTIAENQVPGAAALAEENLVVWAGCAPKVSTTRMAAAIRTALSREWNTRWLVDGYGAQRVTAAMMPGTSTGLRLERADSADCELLFDWRNDPETRAMSFETESIEWATHVKWFEAQAQDPRVEMLVAWLGPWPVAQVRLDSRARDTLLSYGVEPVMRQRGLGREVVAQVMRRAARLGGGRFRAQVKGRNVASRRIFEGLGWQERASGEDYVYRWDCPAAGGEGAP